MKITKLILLLCCSALTSWAQFLKPGFDKSEYRELIYLSSVSFEAPAKAKLIPKPEHSKLLYKSKTMGLDNAWELWLKGENTAVLSTRGSTLKAESWIENLYAAMIPAKGKISIEGTEPFSYALADDPKAAVHTGYLIAMAFLSKDMLPKIDSCYQTGIRDFLIMGHSQGGAISYLLTAYFYNLQKQGKLPEDIRFKTYCSAAPKPGNLYFAYHYEQLTQDGWAYNVVNAADWVPQTPFSVQQLEDFPEVSPVSLVEHTIHQQPFFKRLILKIVYQELQKPTRKAVKKYQRLLGSKMAKKVKAYLPDFKEPNYYPSNDYVRTGNTIVLYPDKDYAEHYPANSKDLMINHSFPPYLYLLNQRIN